MHRNHGSALDAVARAGHLGSKTGAANPFLRSMADRQLVLAIRYDANGKLTWVNDAYCEYCRMQPETLLGRNFIHKIPMDDLLRISKAVMALSPFHPVCRVRHGMMQHDGRLRSHIWVHRAVFDHNAEIAEFIAAGRDVTGRQEDRAYIERVSRELEVHVKALLREQPGGAFTQMFEPHAAGAGNHA